MACKAKVATGVLAALLLCGCGPRVPDRAAYVRIQTLTLLRAREKGSAYAEELEKTLRSEGFERAGFEAAGLAFFDEGACQEIRMGGRGLPGTERPLPRGDYVALRARIFARARIRGTRLADERTALAAVTGLSEEAFEAAAAVWVGDEETDRLILDAYRDLEGARRIPWATWSEIRGRPEWRADPGGAWLDAVLKERGIAPEDWAAAEDLHGLWEPSEED